MNCMYIFTCHIVLLVLVQYFVSAIMVGLSGVGGGGREGTI